METNCRLDQVAPGLTLRSILVRLLSLLLAGLCLSSCGEDRRQAGVPNEVRVADALRLSPQDWTAAGIPGDGGFRVEGEALVLAAGNPMTGVVLGAGTMDPARLPVENYRIGYQALRGEGVDFFGSITFPVGDLKRCVTLVLGGWGGGLVGISSVDGLDASENATRSEQRFENGRWYVIEIEVADGAIRVSIDGRPVVNLSVAGRRLGLRGGDIGLCKPLGFATWATEGRVRRVVIEPLSQVGE